MPIEVERINGRDYVWQLSWRKNVPVRCLVCDCIVDRRRIACPDCGTPVGETGKLVPVGE